MNMGSTSMSGTATAAGAMASSTSTSGMSMGMGMGTGDGPACKISMLWNWYTVDACFISSTWQVTSPGMFAGSCIGVILLVMSLAFLRRLHRGIDAAIARSLSHRADVKPTSDESSDEQRTSGSNGSAIPRFLRPAGYRPSVLQQALRAVLHMFEFGVAYFIMLLAMYYNGYIIISILIGAFLGYFVFEWEPMTAPRVGGKGDAGATEVTGCCG